MKIRFSKMHGTGNDYVFVNCFNGISFEPSELARYVSRRRFSVGSDGLILLLPSDTADARMRIFNADGSEAEMCGNGIRCFAAFAVDESIVTPEREFVTVETMAGIHNVRLVRDDQNQIISAEVGIGFPKAEQRSTARTIQILGCKYEAFSISVGNPHFVVFADSIYSLDLESMHKELSASDEFPNGINLELVESIAENHIGMRVFERGSGITQSCGTGACASAYASVLHGSCDPGYPIRVDVPGGTLYVSIDANGSASLMGPVEKSYTGILDYHHAEVK